ncbi:hypothetical protein V144x_12900 [Gimesia aquarii]|uniref:Uncharacterized protein n=2 Tax=Gimesia aquarii TaxID=2527964 RepID=A0A517VS52_9PLAN|nr:hypothetical protein V144x_12900 [Gimesia aquarii]
MGSMQQLMITPEYSLPKTTTPSDSLMIQKDSLEKTDETQNLSISVLEWLNAELRKEVEKQEIVALETNDNMMDRLQNLLTSKATGITIMMTGLFLM